MYGGTGEGLVHCKTMARLGDNAVKQQCDEALLSLNGTQQLR